MQFSNEVIPVTLVLFGDDDGDKTHLFIAGVKNCGTDVARGLLGKLSRLPWISYSNYTLIFEQEVYKVLHKVFRKSLRHYLVIGPSLFNNAETPES